MIQDELLDVDDDQSENIDYILQAVEQGGPGLLTPEELMTYVQFAQLDMPPDNIDEGHYANLASQMDARTLQKLATEVINWVDWDEESREEWSIRESKGIRLLGVSDETEGGAAFDGASRVVHPLLMESIVQFQSRAIAELWPKTGPVNTTVMGEKTDKTEAQGDRVKQYMNYQYTKQMPGAFEEMDQLLFRLPLSGSCFKKVYYDPILKVVCTRLVEPSDFIVPYSATSLDSAPRYTHRERETQNTVLKKMKLGYYVDQELNRPMNEDYEYPRVKDEIDSTEGKDRTQIDDDQRHTILEMVVDLNLEGFEDKDGIALPYVITVNRDDQSVLRIQRDWRKEDELRKKRVYFSHYKFTPGFGFYGYGLLHLIGGLGNSATGALRALLDSAQYDNLQGGFKSQDAKIEGGDTPIAPGEWREVKSSFEELKNGFYPMPSKPPSSVLFELLGYLDERAQRIASTTDAMVGDVPANMPVGTALQNQENGSKVFSAIHGRLHEAQSKEFTIVAEMNAEYLPADGYPYLLEGIDAQIMREDFDDRVDIIPISDPNLVSQSHRIAQAQGVLDLSEKFPQYVSQKEACEMMLRSMRVADVESLMTPEESDGTQEELAALEIEKLKAEIEKVKAETTVRNVEGLFSSLQAGQTVATIPAVAPIADEIYKSAGGEDKNDFPIATPPSEAAQLPPQYSEQTRINREEMPEMRQNTDPRYPANPVSPVEGVTEGIETVRQDSV